MLSRIKKEIPRKNIQSSSYTGKVNAVQIQQTDVMTSTTVVSYCGLITIYVFTSFANVRIMVFDK